MKTNSMCAVFDNVYEYNELQPITSFRSLSTLYFAGKYRLMDFPLSSIVRYDWELFGNQFCPRNAPEEV